MKSFEDFGKTLDAEFFTNLEKILNETPEVINSPSTGARIHCESAIIATLIIGKYHEWLSEQLP